MRKKFYEFYNDLINDVANEEKREEFLQRLDDIDDEILNLDKAIEEEIGNQEDMIEMEDEFVLADEFNYFNRMPM